MRTIDPPMLTRMTCRTDCAFSGGPAESGAAAHASIHWLSVAACAGTIAAAAYNKNAIAFLIPTEVYRKRAGWQPGIIESPIGRLHAG